MGLHRVCKTCRVITEENDPQWNCDLENGGWYCDECGIPKSPEQKALDRLVGTIMTANKEALRQAFLTGGYTIELEDGGGKKITLLPTPPE